MKKIDYPREQLSVRLELELAKAFKIALIQRGETAQSVLEQAVKDYINPKEGNDMENKIYAVNAEEGWQGGNQLYTVHGYTTAFDGMIIVTDITEDELENDDAVTYYREVTVVEPNSKIAEAAKPCVYFPPEDKMGYGIIF